MTRGAVALVEERRNRGRLMSSQQIADQKFGGTVDEGWVRRNLPNKVVFSKRLVRWYESDVDSFIESRRAREG